MSKLISVDALRERLTANDVAFVNNLIEDVLQATTVILRSLIRVDSFDSIVGGSEVFFLGAGYSDIYGSMPLFRLKNGFVSNVVVKLHTTRVDISTDGELIDTDYLIIDEEAGTVKVDRVFANVAVLNFDIQNSYFEITYDSGFSVNGQDVYESVPEWLKEMAVLKGMDSYRVSNDCEAQSGECLQTLLAKYTRVFPLEIEAIG